MPVMVPSRHIRASKMASRQKLIISETKDTLVCQGKEHFSEGSGSLSDGS